MGRGGGIAEWLARLLRFWMVAVGRKLSRAPVRHRNLGLTIESMCLASPKSVSVFLRSMPEGRVSLGLHQGADIVARRLIDITSDLARR